MRTTRHTKLIGVLTHPIGENLIHDMFSAAAEITGDDVAFLLFDAQAKEIAVPMAALQKIGAAGVYLTGRLRGSALGLVDYLTDEAHGTGVINTISIEGDETTGHNTEARALIATLEPLRDQFVSGGAVLLGGGAMARSVAHALVRHFRVKHLAIADRTLQQAQILKQTFTGAKSDTKIEAHELFPPDIAQLLSEARLIVNTTALGAFPNIEETPITTLDIFHDRQIVLDTNYSPAITRLLHDAAQRGATTISGIEILISQIADAYHLLTAQPFPVDEIRKLLVTNQD
jgi:shikimate dehydrogenase